RMKKKAAAPAPPAPPMGANMYGKVVSWSIRLGAAFPPLPVGTDVTWTVKLNVFEGRFTGVTTAVMSADPGLLGLKIIDDNPVLSVLSSTVGSPAGVVVEVDLVEVLEAMAVVVEMVEAFVSGGVATM